MPDSVSLTPEPTGKDDLSQLAGDLVMLSKRIRAVFGIAVAELGFHNGQDHLIMVLMPRTAMAVSTLAAELDVRPSTVSKMIDRLVEKDLVQRLADRQDSRKTLVTLTSSGLEAQAAIRALWERVSRNLAPTNEDAALLSSQVRQINDALRSRLLRLR